MRFLKKPLLWIVILSALVGLYAGRKANEFLAISIEEKTLPEPVDTSIEGPFPSLPWRIIDLGGVGIVPDSSQWGQDYSHNDKRFENIFFAGEPFVDSTAFMAMFDEYRPFVDRMVRLGFNAIEIPGFLQFINFDRVGSGFDIYLEDSVFRRRHRVIGRYYRKLFDYAAERGMRVVLNTDMVALTPPLENYLKGSAGEIDVDSDAFWEVYQRGLNELFEKMPMVAGIIIRIGEAGAVYNRSGWDYRSELWVRSVASVKKMLSAFLEVAEKHDRYIIFRTWSVGVGAVGDMHTNPESYHTVLDDIDSDHLIVSTKFTKGDFWNHLPLNPTLFTGRHRRIIELQDRREFEAFNVIPNFVSPLHQVALTSFMKSNPHIEGVWAWSQTGGPLRHGPLMLYPFHGFWLWTDANVYATARIIRQPAVDIQGVVRDWAALRFGDDRVVIDVIAKVLLHSHETAMKGLTVPAFAKKEVHGLGLEVPPVIYSYWDIVDASSSVMSHVYLTARGDVDRAVAESFEAVDEVRTMEGDLAGIKDRISRGGEWIPDMLASLEYEENLVETLAHHKAFMLYFYEWLDTGGPMAKQRWEDALREYLQARQTHYERYKGNLTFPAYNFEIADAGAIHAQRTDTVILVARGLLIFLVVGISLIAWGKAATGRNRGWTFVLTVLVVGSVGAFSSFAAPTFTLTVALPSIVYLLGLRFLIFKSSPGQSYLWAISPLLVFLILLLSLMATRGPYYFWFQFWTSDSFRLQTIVSIVVLVTAHVTLVLSASTRSAPLFWGWGVLLLLTGMPAAIYASILQLTGFEQMLARLNDELLVLPGMLSRVLGITTHLDIPLDTPDYLLIIGEVMVLLGAVMAVVGRVVRRV